MPVYLSATTDQPARAQGEGDIPTIGRDLDLRIALDVMCWQRSGSDDLFWDGQRSRYLLSVAVTRQRMGLPYSCGLFSPSTRIEDAWAVVEKLRSAGWLVVLKEMPDGFPYIIEDSASDVKIHRRCVVNLTWMSTATPEDCRKRIHSHTFTIADTMPEAICRAALKARESDR